MKKMIFLVMGLLGFVLCSSVGESVEVISTRSCGHKVSHSGKTGATNAICSQKYDVSIIGISQRKTIRNTTGNKTVSVYDGKMNGNIAWVGGHVHR